MDYRDGIVIGVAVVIVLWLLMMGLTVWVERICEEVEDDDE